MGGEQTGICYRRRGIQLANCVKDSTWDLFIKKDSTTGGKGWKEEAGLDCYAGRGGLPIQPDPFSNQLPLADCRAACDSRPACEGIVTGTSGQCYLRTKLDLSRCVRDPKWTLHLAPRFSGPTTGPTTTTHLPEHAFLDPGYWNERARGLGATVAVPLGSSAEENALCDSNDRYRGEDITVHEFAHSLHLLGFALVYPSFNRELQGLYNAARAANVWGGSHYAMTDFKEYFAEGVQSFFNCNMADSYAPTDRNQLSRRDPNLYAFLLRYLGNNTWSHSC